ncbi:MULTISPECIES: dual specificity protein phosphatase family protein [Paenibacillus]|uniref:protein-tyrosine phosphatase family protein n=1 Tax=Paenibacillus TaxID=44249 RepID=UPI0009567F37|nr:MULTISPECIES: dual specificity protein phosphatase family protein [Paenibacillus]ASS68144.1 protein tyrosine phosphatase [Paenibacillus sp. RUD330]MEC0246343.1 dual specificity protein phosphatase family protein [Paenibacillus chitinolyticus]SIR69081.1 Dual specificity phosphatase, catalytic domain [Paenibacillus sp. RU4X]SIR76435.1 Dual specificity phosphatase, catalytic domain [Paenibacillus sp. RU4T]
MSSEKNYHALIRDKIFMGAATDVESMVKNEGIDVIVDLRGEAKECAYPAANVKWIQIPLADNSAGPQEKAFEQAIKAITEAFYQNKKVAFHCGGGKGRTGTVAAGTLLALGLSDTLDEAEAKAKSIRNIIDIKPSQRESLHKLYPGK